MRSFPTVKRFRTDMVAAIKSRKAQGRTLIYERSITPCGECALVMLYQYNLGGTKLLDEHFQNIVGELRDRYELFFMSLCLFLGGYEDSFRPGREATGEGKAMWRLGRAIRRWGRPVSARHG